MIFHLSQKLNAKIKAGRLVELPMDENPFADWSGHLFTIGRTQYILVSNTKSLFSTVILDKGINESSSPMIISRLSSAAASLRVPGRSNSPRRSTEPSPVR